MKKARTKGIFCLECDWWGIEDKTTVEPVLNLLQTFSFTHTPYIHRDVATCEEFWFYLDKWADDTINSYEILYLGFHGDENIIYVSEDYESEKGQVTLEELASRLKGKCKGRLIHFGSCSTLDLHGARINTFLRTTGAAAVCGYRQEVDWLQSAAFEILLLGLMQEFSFRKQGLKAIDKRLRSKAPGLYKELRFRIKIRP